MRPTIFNPVQVMQLVVGDTLIIYTFDTNIYIKSATKYHTLNEELS